MKNVMAEDRSVIVAYHPQYGWIDRVLNFETHRTKYTKNEIRVYESGVCEIDVYDIFGRYKATGLFSEEDLHLVKDHKWYQDSVGYLSTTINGKKVRLHRLLFPQHMTDHYDGNKLNNLRNNLQNITPAVNIAKITGKMFNPTGVTGVYFTRSNTWQAAIEQNKVKRTKNFKTREDAVLMRYIWELNAWGKNAPQLNDIARTYPRLFAAMERGYKISENIELVKAILKHLDDSPYCPCRIEKSADTKCMCKEFRDGNTLGACHCGLYVKVEL